MVTHLTRLYITFLELVHQSRKPRRLIRPEKLQATGNLTLPDLTCYFRGVAGRQFLLFLVIWDLFLVFSHGINYLSYKVFYFSSFFLAFQHYSDEVLAEAKNVCSAVSSFPYTYQNSLVSLLPRRCLCFAKHLRHVLVCLAVFLFIHF